MVCHFSILLLSFTAFLLGFGYSPLSKPDTPSLDNLDDFSFINPLLSLSPSEQSRRQSNIRSLTVRLEIAVHLAPHFNADAGRIVSHANIAFDLERQYRELDALFPFGNAPDMSGALQPISQLMLWLSIIIEHPALVNASSELQELADYAGTCCGSSAWHEEFYRRPMVTPSEPETTPPPLPADPVPEDVNADLVSIRLPASASRQPTSPFRMPSSSALSPIDVDILLPPPTPHVHSASLPFGSLLSPFLDHTTSPSSSIMMS
ncbi:hypothetical protein C8J56DRAFT_1046334 [Mycena floridula]|nr:hypothetical protein C8J56DRAFT_1046334 [Mycena floridula]